MKRWLRGEESTPLDVTTLSFSLSRRGIPNPTIRRFHTFRIQYSVFSTSTYFGTKYFSIRHSDVKLPLYLGYISRDLISLSLINPKLTPGLLSIIVVFFIDLHSCRTVDLVRSRHSTRSRHDCRTDHRSREDHTLPLQRWYERFQARLPFLARLVTSVTTSRRFRLGLRPNLLQQPVHP